MVVWRQVLGCSAAVLLACGCTKSGGGQRAASGIASSTSAAGSADVPTLCVQWQRVDAELAAETLTARDEIAVLADLLPAAYKQDAALFYYPGAGDPGPNADGSMADDAGRRLRTLRREVCGN